MTKDLDLQLEPAPSSANVPEGTTLSVINFSILADTKELMAGLIGKLDEITQNMALMRGVKIEQVPLNETEVKFWLNYAIGVLPEHLVQCLNMLNDFGGNVAIEAHERYDFPEGTIFYGPQAEVLYSGKKKLNTQETEDHNVKSYLLGTVYAQEVQNRALRRRVEELENLTTEHSQQIQSLDEHLRGNTVMNFEYRGMHSIPQMLWALIEHVGADGVKKKFEDLMQAEYPDHHILH